MSQYCGCSLTDLARDLDIDLPRGLTPVQNKNYGKVYVPDNYEPKLIWFRAKSYEKYVSYETKCPWIAKCEVVMKTIQDDLEKKFRDVKKWKKK
jgi:hypothetical protein